jgi:hypothetical protein
MQQAKQQGQALVLKEISIRLRQDSISLKNLALLAFSNCSNDFLFFLFLLVAI